MLTIPTAKVFEPLLQPARYLGAYGGRGGGKSHFFGELLVESGTLAICIREVQRTLAQSSKRLIETKIRDLGVGSEFRIFHDRIETPGVRRRSSTKARRSSSAKSRRGARPSLRQAVFWNLPLKRRLG